MTRIDNQGNTKPSREYFRLWNPIKVEGGRKPAHDSNGSKEDFNIWTDSWFDWPMVVQSRMNGNWEDYNRLVTIQSAYCPLSCWHCYVEDEFKEAKTENSVYASAGEILEGFFEQKERDEQNGEIDRVIRVSGGEPLLMPEMTLELLERLRSGGHDKEVFVWTDTNMIPLIRNDSGDLPIEDWINLDKLKEFRNFCLYPCFHGISPSNFTWITGCDKRYFDGFFDVLALLIDKRIDFYPTFGSNVSKPADVEPFFNRLVDINEKLPLRFALIEYSLNYDPVIERVKREERPYVLYNKLLVIKRWNELLNSRYKKGYAEEPRHEVKLW
ncbi:MAG: 4Fe-4S cluster-binding domain-containing protein [Promethearchaeota archaeon]